MIPFRFFAVLTAALAPAVSALATNTNEALAGTFTLPDPLILKNGRPVKDAKTWMEKRRPEIVKLYEDRIYGHSPKAPKMKVDVWDVNRQALDGRALRKQINISFEGHTNGPVFHVVMYTPADAPGPVPVFLCLSFSANYKIVDDVALEVTKVWDRKKDVQVMPTDETHGTSHSWKIPETLERGYGVAAVYYCDIEPDLDDGTGYKYGVRSMFAKPGKKSATDDWGAISAWAWGASRIMDYLQTDADVDKNHVIMLGQSRLGKTALWAGAEDPRFAMVIASCSGEMGAALARRDYGETVTSMSKSFPYQFCGNFLSYSNHIDQMPVDSHMLVALIAPRPLYLSTGSEDRWSDPHGEFEAAIAAAPVYRLFGKQSVVTNLPPAPARGGSGAVLRSEFLNTFPMPPLDHAIMNDIAFSCHTGKHDILPDDWNRFLDFADLHFKNGGTK
jgi:hypothetical protein